MHRFNICLVVLSLSCSGVKTPLISLISIFQFAPTPASSLSLSLCFSLPLSPSSLTSTHHSLLSCTFKFPLLMVCHPYCEFFPRAFLSLQLYMAATAGIKFTLRIIPIRDGNKEGIQMTNYFPRAFGPTIFSRACTRSCQFNEEMLTQTS